MSRLNELVAELCPDGVEYRPLGEVAPFVRERANTDDAQFDAYVGVDALLQNKEGRDLTKTDIPTGRHIYFRPGDTLVGNIRPYLKKIWYADCFGGTNGDVLVFRSVGGIEAKFLYHVLASDAFFDYDNGHARGSKMPRGDKSFIQAYRIPVPPIEVQREIVRILDSFQDLDDALTAEIEAREKQFENYRDELLGSRLSKICPDGVEYKALGECLSAVKNSMVDGPFGSNLKKEHYTDRHEVRVVQLSNIGEGGWVDDNERYTTFEHLQSISRHEAFPGDIVIAKMFPAGRAIILPNLGVKYVLSSDAIRFVPSDALDKRYAYYAINSDAFRKQVARDTQGATRPRTGITKLKQNRIPVPPIEVQREIVSKLDVFQSHIEAMVSERDARRKQFAYYRDKLLSFPEKVTTNG